MEDDEDVAVIVSGSLMMWSNQKETLITAFDRLVCLIANQPHRADRSIKTEA